MSTILALSFSIRCPVFTRAQDIHTRVVHENWPRSTTGKLYASLYSSSSPRHNPLHPTSSPPLSSSFSPYSGPLPASSLHISHPITPTSPRPSAKRKHSHPPSPTPFHLTPEYMDIVHGPTSSAPLDSLPTISQLLSTSSSSDHPPPSTPSTSLPATAASILPLLLDFFTKLLHHAATYLASLLSSDPGPLASNLQPLLASVSSHLSASSS